MTLCFQTRKILRGMSLHRGLPRSKVCISFIQNSGMLASCTARHTSWRVSPHSSRSAFARVYFPLRRCNALYTARRETPKRAAIWTTDTSAWSFSSSENDGSFICHRPKRQNRQVRKLGGCTTVQRVSLDSSQCIGYARRFFLPALRCTVQAMLPVLLCP